MSALSSKYSNTVRTVLKITLAVGLIYWMIRKGALDLNAFAKIATPSLMAFCVGTVLVQLFINNYRWLVLMRAQGLHSSVRRTMPLSFIGMFFNFVMPGGVGGDVVKGYYLLQEFPRQKFSGAISIFMDRMVGFFVMIGTAFFAVFFNWHTVSHSSELKSLAVAVTILFAVFILFFSVALSRRIGRTLFDSWVGTFLFERFPGGAHLRRLYEIVHAYRNEPTRFATAIGISMINQLLMAGFVFGVAMAMDVHEIPVAVYFFLVPLGMVVMALPISPAGIGVGQAAFYFLFSLYLGKSSQLGPTAVTVMQVTNFAWGLFGAFFYLQRKRPEIPNLVV